MKSILAVILLSGIATAETGKILDVAPYNEHGAPQVTVIQGYPNCIVTQGSWEMFTVTVAMDGMAYSVNFKITRKARI